MHLTIMGKDWDLVIQYVVAVLSSEQMFSIKMKLQGICFSFFIFEPIGPDNP